MSSKKKKGTSSARLSPATLRKRVPSDSAGAAAASSVALSSNSASATAMPAASSSSSSSSASGRRNPFGSRFLFLTVGTTRFDSLLTALNERAEELVQWMRREGYGRAMFQIGTGSVEPTAIQAAAAASNDPLGGARLRIEWIRHSPDLLGYLSSADLVISHAGAGSILESLRLFRPLLVVINTCLMHNHQLEVAQALERGRFLYQTEPARVLQFLERANWSMPVEATSRRSQGEPAVAAAATGETQSSSGHQNVPRYQLLRYPPVQPDAFPQMLEEHVAQVMRPTSTVAKLQPMLLTVILPAVMAFAITWMIV